MKNRWNKGRNERNTEGKKEVSSRKKGLRE